MKGFVVSIVLFFVALTSSAGSTYDVTAKKASRFFEAREWASAQALYGLMLAERPDVDSVYVNAMISSTMIGDTIRASHLLSEAMSAGLSFTRLMAGVKEVSFRISEPEVYEDFLLRSQRDCPWLVRAIDAELLSYYLFRDNGAMIVRYSEKMLAGLPDSTDYLAALASGYAIEGDFDKAVATWRRIIEIAPDNYDTLLKLGNYFDLKGNPTEALRYLTQAQKLHATPFVASRISRLAGNEKNK